MFGTERSNAHRVTSILKVFGMFDDAEYLRAQARLCLDISRQMSARSDRVYFERRAAEYIVQAEQTEQDQFAVNDGTH